MRKLPLLPGGHRQISYCWHPKLRILVGAEWWCQWWDAVPILRLMPELEILEPSGQLAAESLRERDRVAAGHEDHLVDAELGEHAHLVDDARRRRRDCSSTASSS